MPNPPHTDFEKKGKSSEAELTGDLGSLNSIIKPHNASEPSNQTEAEIFHIERLLLDLEERKRIVLDFIISNATMYKILEQDQALQEKRLQKLKGIQIDRLISERDIND